MAIIDSIAIFLMIEIFLKFSIIEFVYNNIISVILFSLLYMVLGFVYFNLTVRFKIKSMVSMYKDKILSNPIKYHTCGNYMLCMGSHGYDNIDSFIFDIKNRINRNIDELDYNKMLKILYWLIHMIASILSYPLKMLYKLSTLSRASLIENELFNIEKMCKYQWASAERVKHDYIEQTKVTQELAKKENVEEQQINLPTDIVVEKKKKKKSKK